MNKRILYVDDEYPNRITFQITYRGVLEVLLAASADEGLSILADSTNIGHVISDMRMPGKNGLEFIKEAKNNHPEIKYCLLTGFEITPEIQDALSDGTIQKYFQKPFDREKILDFLQGE
ncbi:MAG: response regulator [Marinoscillum sp.]